MTLKRAQKEFLGKNYKFTINQFPRESKSKTGAQILGVA
jgi:hypothetical protein